MRGRRPWEVLWVGLIDQDHLPVVAIGILLALDVFLQSGKVQSRFFVFLFEGLEEGFLLTADLQLLAQVVFCFFLLWGEVLGALAAGGGAATAGCCC
jgi:hypothetical protein